jgi:hypothetical protein
MCAGPAHQRERIRRWAGGEKRVDDLVVVKLGRAWKPGRNEAYGLLMLPGSEKEKEGRVGLNRLKKNKKR